MNGTEQRDHTRVTDRLAADIRELVKALEAVSENTLARFTEAEKAALSRAQAEERRTDAAFLAAKIGVDNQMAAQRRNLSALNLDLGRVAAVHLAFAGMRFWPRLWWLLTGRTP